MHHILQLNSSIFGAEGRSTQLANRLVAELRERQPGAQLTVRDLAANPVPHLDSARFRAFASAPETRTSVQQAVVSYSDVLIAELQQADTLVIGVPMYNFGVPTGLKAYFDHIARAGVTFRYTATGPEGLLNGKKVYVVATRGGRYQDTPLDTQTDYLRNFFGLLGLTDVEFIYAEGLNMGDEEARAGLDAARDHMHRIAA